MVISFTNYNTARLYDATKAATGHHTHHLPSKCCHDNLSFFPPKKRKDPKDVQTEQIYSSIWGKIISVAIKDLVSTFETAFVCANLIWGGGATNQSRVMKSQHLQLT